MKNLRQEAPDYHANLLFHLYMRSQTLRKQYNEQLKQNLRIR